MGAIRTDSELSVRIEQTVFQTTGWRLMLVHLFGFLAQARQGYSDDDKRKHRSRSDQIGVDMGQQLPVLHRGSPFGCGGGNRRRMPACKFCNHEPTKAIVSCRMEPADLMAS